jgi:phytol kinase
MFVFTFIMTIVALFYYNISITLLVLLVLAFIAFVTSIVEAVTPMGLDNLTVPFVAVFIYWLFFLSGMICV